MAQPLPDGFVDTGITKTITVSANIRIYVFRGVRHITLNEWRFSDLSVVSACNNPSFPPDYGTGERRLELTGPGVPTVVLITEPFY